MKILDYLLNKMGYVKAQTKLTDIEPSTDEDRNRIDRLENNNTDIIDNPVQPTYPEQLSGEPRVPMPQVDLNQNLKEVVKVQSPDNPYLADPQETGGPPKTYPDINEDHINTPRVLDIDEVDKHNHAIAMKMKKMGIQSIREDMFLSKYNEICKKAALAGKPISDYLDQIL